MCVINYILCDILNRTFEKKDILLISILNQLKEIEDTVKRDVMLTSTDLMRQSKGYDIIKDAITKLSKKHEYHMERYGEGNNERMTGEHETASYDKFSFGVAK